MDGSHNTPHPAPDLTEMESRVRAAIAYSRKSRDQLIAVLPFSNSVLSRLAGRDSANRRLADLEERQAIADATGVPRLFMEQGFDALRAAVPSVDADERLRRLEAYSDEHGGVLSELLDAVADLSAGLAGVRREIHTALQGDAHAGLEQIESQSPSADRGEAGRSPGA